MRLKQTWRWFGPNDQISLAHIRQAGAQGIVSALHHVPHGDVWTVEEINQHKAKIEAAGLTWDVVESVTVHEDIKTRSGNYQQYIAQYQESIRNIAACGIPVLTYNFMPVQDWTRTSVDYEMPDGAKALYFDLAELAMFDIYILKRKNAEASYDENTLAKAAEKNKQYSSSQKDALVTTILLGIPGEKKLTPATLLERIEVYDNISREQLQDNLKYFLEQVSPVAEEAGIRLAIHPDDPPFDILGLPRIVSTQADLQFILDATGSKANGLCFCTGSLGANPDNDLPAMVKQFGSRIHFAHLRNVSRTAEGNFYEDAHLGGRVNMYAVMKELLRAQQSVSYQIPFRPDHGHQMLDDLQKTGVPGYSAIGRLRGLAELRGLELGIAENEGW